MIHLAVPIALAALLFAPQEPGSLDALKQALASGDDVMRVQAIDAVRPDAEPAVAEALAKLLGDRNTPVAVAAANALGRLTCAPALEALHRYAKGSAAAKHPARLVAVLRAVARHGDPSSIDVLARTPANPPDYRVIRARIYGLAHIRSPDAVDALLDLMNLDRQTSVEPAVFSEDFRTALRILTGVDQGPSKEFWDAWWRRQDKSKVLPLGRPWLPDLPRLRYEGGMGEAYEPELPEPTAPDTTGSTVGSTVAALKGSDASARDAALAFLGHMNSKDALDALIAAVRSKSAKDDPELFAALLRAIGRHGDPSTIAVLSNKPFAVPTFGAVRARIYGLANVRTNEAIDALIAMIQLGSPSPGQPFVFMDDAGTALSGAHRRRQGSIEDRLDPVVARPPRHVPGARRTPVAAGARQAAVGGLLDGALPDFGAAPRAAGRWRHGSRGGAEGARRQGPRGTLHGRRRVDAHVRSRVARGAAPRRRIEERAERPTAARRRAAGDRPSR